MDILKILKFTWILSFLGVNLCLFYVYAGLPEMVAYSGDIEISLDYIDKEYFFYFFLISISLVNVIIYYLTGRGVGSKSLSNYKFYRVVSWEYGLAAVINIFFTISLLFFSIFNSGEKFEYSNFGYLVYFSLALVALWVISLPFVIYSARIKI